MMTIKNKFTLFVFFSFLFYGVLIYSFYKAASRGVDTHKSNLITKADLHYEDIVNTRAWNASLGGIYAYPGHYKPNPYLKNNTIKDSNGKTMIKINPAWMTRMLSEHSKSSDFKFYLKSNNPVNPVNKATGFYEKALNDMSQTVPADDTKRYRVVEKTKKLEYVKGMYLNQSCLTCHNREGDKLGSLRGGVVLEINAGFYLQRKNGIWNEFYIISTIITFLYIFLMIVVYKFLRRTKEVEMLNSTLEEKIKEKTAKLDNALEGARLGYWNWNIQTKKHTVDDRWLLMLGLTKDDILNKEEDWSKRIHQDDLQNVKTVIDNAIAKEQPYVVEFRMKHKDGNYVWIQGSGSIISYDNNNKPLELAGTHQDITKRKELEQKEIQNSIFLNNLFDKNPNIIIVTNGKKLLKVNQTFFNFFNEYDSLESFLEEHDCICEFFDSEKDDDFISNEKDIWIEEVFSQKNPMVKISYKSKVHYFSVLANKIFEEDNEHFIVIFSDITEMYNLKKEYEQLSITDSLTTLYNRRSFSKIFTQEIHRAFRNKHSFTLLIIDVDFFKLYNDNYGHDMGDILLQKLSAQLKISSKRSNEFVFRLGGEEFGVIYSELSKEDSLNHAQDICDSVKHMGLEHKFNPPFDVLTVSIGHFYTSSIEYLEADTIYHYADKALYHAKEHGRNRVDDYDDIKAI